MPQNCMGFHLSGTLLKGLKFDESAQYLKLLEQIC